MTTPDMLELAMTAMLTTMQNNLPAMLTTLAAGYSDAATPLPAPKAYFDGPRREVPEYPALLVWYPEDPSEFEPNSSSNNTASMKHHLIVEAAITTDSEKGLNAMGRRYGEAIAQVIFRNQTLGGKVMSALPRKMVRSQAVQQGKSGMAKSALLQSVAWRVEVRHFTEW